MRRLVIVLLLLPSVVLAVEPFGRLFTTPAERANLDHMRQTRKIEPVTVDQPQEVEVAPTLPSEISVQGYVKRSDGKKGTVWVNETPMQENTGTSEVEVGSLPKGGNQVPLKVPGTGINLKLKAGQVYDPETDEITENARSRIQESGSIGVAPSGNESAAKTAQ